LGVQNNRIIIKYIHWTRWKDFEKDNLMGDKPKTISKKSSVETDFFLFTFFKFFLHFSVFSNKIELEFEMGRAKMNAFHLIFK